MIEVGRADIFILIELSGITPHRTSRTSKDGIYNRKDKAIMIF